MYWKLLKELFVHFLDIQSFFNPAPTPVADHQPGELVAINEHDSLAQLLGGLTCRR
jgi:hypothetical protein